MENKGKSDPFPNEVRETHPGSGLPDTQQRKYGIINIIFLLFLFCLNVAALLSVSHAVIILIPLTFLVVFRKTKYYHWFTFIGGVAVIIIFAGLVIGEISIRENMTEIFVGLITALIFILFGIIMPGHLHPGPYLKSKSKT